jgi:hypothetical protein
MIQEFYRGNVETNSGVPHVAFKYKMKELDTLELLVV